MSLLAADLAAPVAETSYVAAPGVVRVEVDGRPLLFGEAGQQLVELNPTADLIWRGVASGEPPSQVVETLVALGVAPTDADAFVKSCLQAWLAGGQLIPTAALDALAQAPVAVRHVALDELSVTLSFHGSVDVAAVDAVFGHLCAGRPGDGVRLAVVGIGALYVLFVGGRSLPPVGPDGLAPAIKATLTDHYVQAVSGAFLAHGALLVRDGRSVFLSGDPGAGKTTLTLALSAAGFQYGGDDIVRIEPDGRVLAAPFAAAVKSGAWPLVEAFAPAVAGLPTWLRADSQRVRYYLPPNRAERSPRTLDAVLLLDRQAGAAAALQPLHAVDALTAILASAYSARGALDAAALQGLAGSVARARPHRLVYSDLDAAVALIAGLLDD
ncbi:hypothetical protein [Phenylobacterium sp.]|uniref:hypothetical protein n=1 Tax=Phenylobacterium sp. TaxID=1871053 RepID=UPI002F955816